MANNDPNSQLYVNNDYGHAGSWGIGGIKLPDWGVTELASSILNGGNATAQGGSNITDLIGGGQTTQQNQPYTPPTFGQTVQRLNTLGASTVNNNTSTNNQTKSTNNGGGGGGGSSAFPANQYIGWDPAAAQADWNAKVKAGQTGGGGGGQADLSSLISEMYAPALQALTNIEGSIGGIKDSSLANTDQSYNEGKTSIGNEGKELEASLNDQSQRLEKSGQSAFAEAVRNLNSLFQGLASRFGSGSSAGLAAGELMGQEFLRNQGKMRNQLEEGRQQIAQETTKMKNYIADKVTQLDQWKRDAIAKINENFTNAMNQIAMRRGDIEANKTKDRVALLQDAVNKARDIESKEQEFKLGLAQFAVQTLQQTSAKNFTPQEIASVVNDMLGQNISGFQSNTNPSYSAVNPYSLSQKQKDELSSLNPLT